MTAMTTTRTIMMDDDGWMMTDDDDDDDGDDDDDDGGGGADDDDDVWGYAGATYGTFLPCGKRFEYFVSESTWWGGCSLWEVLLE